MRLLLIEDDAILGAGLRDCLAADGHVVDWCQRLLQTALLKNEPYDALLVDWQLPDGSGLDWIRAYRQHDDHTAILLLTARDLLHDRVQGLDAGADDYLVKPFAPEELAARIRAVRRRTAGMAQARVTLGSVALDLTQRCAYIDGARTELTTREWAITEALALRPGRLVCKRELEALVLGLEGDVASNSLEVHVSNIRRKLGRHCIETVRGMGYRLTT
ncbi:MAG: response regulator transcription factor [Rubrivivax sp.]|nr:response regulator transcription factor [Rubrivivax sp.]